MLACLNEEQVYHEHRQKVGFAARMPTCSGGQLTLRCILLFLLSSRLSGGETLDVVSMFRSFRCMSFARILRGLLYAACCHLTENELILVCAGLKRAGRRRGSVQCCAHFDGPSSHNLDARQPLDSIDYEWRVS